MFKKRTPLLSHLIRSLCSVEPGEHAGNRAILRQKDQAAIGKYGRRLGNTNASIEQGWNEGDECSDNEQWHSKSSVIGGTDPDDDTDQGEYRQNGRSRNGLAGSEAPAPAVTILQRARKI